MDDTNKTVVVEKPPQPPPQQQEDPKNLIQALLIDKVLIGKLVRILLYNIGGFATFSDNEVEQIAGIVCNIATFAWSMYNFKKSKV